MHRLKSYVELLLVVSVFPFAMPQVRNLSPLRGILNTDLPDSFRTTTVSSFASAGAPAGESVGDRFIPLFNIENAPGALGTSVGADAGFSSFGGGGGGAILSATASSFGGSSVGFGDGGGAAIGLGGGGFPNNIISADDVEDALRFAFGESTSSNRVRPQVQTLPVAASFPQSLGASGAIGDRLTPQVQQTQEQRPPFPSGVAAGSAASGASGGFPGGTIAEADEVLGGGLEVNSFGAPCAPIPDPVLEGTSRAHFGFRRTQLASERESNCIGRPVEGASIRLALINSLRPGETITELEEDSCLRLTAAEVIKLLTNIEFDEESCLKLQPTNCSNVISPFVGDLCKPNDPYRTLDGSCNNLRNPEWGTSKRRFNRYLQPAYDDGISMMRGDCHEIPLPSARTVSARLQKISQKPPREDLTMLVMQWGQFLDHDLTHTPEATRLDGDNTTSPIACCEFGVPGSCFPRNVHCRPIDVSNDQLHRYKGRRCMRFVRSLVANKGCSTGSLGPREQQNQVTSYLDASQVYGSDDEEAKGLRSWFGGLLRDSKPPSVGHGTFLPRMKCMESSNYEPNCFEAGDVRVNEQPALTSMHTLWLRVHNNIARDLTSFNPSWSDQRLYQETRRIVAALHQQITYREFLPIVHGPDFSKGFQLNLQDQGYDNSYNANVDATIANVFATAAFRFGHTLIAESFKGMGRNVTLRGNFDEPLVLNDPSTSPSAILQGLTACPTQGADAFLTPTLVNHLLSKSSDPVGFDLMSLNIQRGRDHGLQPYHKWRQSCGLSPINSFEDLYSIMDLEAANVFRQSYQRVEEIDLFPAALAENTIPGGLLGPTFSCLISQQFQALKIGDRFWYENRNQPNPFTPGQLSALREQSLASIMCQHLGLDSLQPMVFRSERLHGNQLQYCSAFPRLNLSSWSQDPYNPPNPTNPYPNPNPKPKPTHPKRYRPKFPWCITQGTPKSHLNWFFPMCTPDLFIKNN